MRTAGLQGICHRRKRGRHRPLPAPHEDLVRRRFVRRRPEPAVVHRRHRAPHRGPARCTAARSSTCSPGAIVGWSIADHIRTELVVDALQMATWRRHPQPGTVVHADRGPQYTSWVFGHRLRQAGLLGSMGRVASRVDNTMIESFWSTMQRELLDIRSWDNQEQLASAIFEWIEGWYNPRRRHTSLGNVAPAQYEALHTAATPAA